MLQHFSVLKEGAYTWLPWEIISYLRDFIEPNTACFIPMKFIGQHVFATKEFLMTFTVIATLQFQLFFLIMLANGDKLNLLPLSGFFP